MGLVDMLGLRRRVLATVHTGGKALGVMGGYVCGSRLLKESGQSLSPFDLHDSFAADLGMWWLEALQRTLNNESGRAVA